MADVSLTQRAYTLRLKGADPKDQSWRDKLWKTHEAVNKGAKVFGDWLLTLRGGLSHELVDMKVKNKKGEEFDPSPDEVKDRRTVLALSWLSVESEKGAPAKYFVQNDLDAQSDKRSNWRTVDTLKEILKTRGVSDTEIEQWVRDCSASLRAAIREDAVWVNRSKAFDEIKNNNVLTQEGIWDFLNPFFSSPETYLKSVKGTDSSENNNDESERSSEEEEKVKDLVQKAGGWLSRRFGTGKGADFSNMIKVYDVIATWASTAIPNQSGQATIASLAQALSTFSPASHDLNGVLGLVSGPGYKSATQNQLKKINNNESVTQGDLDKLNEVACKDSQNCTQKSGNKGKRDYAGKVLKEVEDACGFTYLQNGGAARHYEFSVMLDHAARRVSLAHTWTKRAEAERRKFEEDAKKITNVPAKAKEWLDRFREERSETSGSIEGYRIRKRAVDGWKEIVKEWSKPECKTEDDRIAAARALQDDPEIDKFGDIQLFEALAGDEAKCVWQQNGNPTPQPLLDYVAAVDAEAKKRRFKVPAYRHPDALLHPVFCDFGNSRWNISFAMHRAYKSLTDAERDVINKLKKLEEAKAATQRAMTEDKRNKAKEEEKQAAERLKKAEEILAWLKDNHGLTMNLLDENNVKETQLRWSSKLLASDLVLKQDGTENPVDVSRASRLGRAVAKVAKDATVNIAGLFEQNDWNGRLQAPREQLEMIARLEKKLPEKVDYMRNNIKWLITFSPRLQPQGPWIDYAEKFADDSPAWPFVSRKGEYAVKHKDNDSRKSYAKLILSRLPGLRVLSVDLGHRHAAACAVWETLTKEQVEEACKSTGVKLPSENDMYLHIESIANNGKEKAIIYRRIGLDTLNGSPHPAPWARLDRQFLIKLQGEEREARIATADEIWQVHELERELGRNMPLVDRLVNAGWGNTEKQRLLLDELKKIGWKPIEGSAKTEDEEEIYIRRPSLSVDDFMSEAVNTVRLALRRHGEYSRIAQYLISDEKAMSGGQPKKLDEVGRIAQITDALMKWHGLTTSRQWADNESETLWREHFPEIKPSKVDDEGKSQQQIKKEKKEFRENILKPIAEKLAKNESLRMKLSVQWTTRWRENDDNWNKRLRWLRDWILPRGSRENDKTIRNVGGLSLTRIATMKSLYQVQKAFYMRLKPDGSHETAKEGFGQSVLDAMENMREQRVKQLASRIAEAALGVGHIKISKNGKDPKRPCEQVDAPCHAVVIENLTHYRPEETRTRRENRQLMQWSSAKVKKYLLEACQLHGLHLREVSAGYTSRQDSRTGAPGIRCEDVPVKEFLESPFWKKETERAEKKQKENKGDARDKYLLALKKKWSKESASTCSLRIPRKGGEIFVSADANSPASKGLHADLNAAANIGLKALLDSDWPGRWWYVPCDSKEFKPLKDKVNGSTVIDVNQPLKTAITKDASDDSYRKAKMKSVKQKGEGKSKDVVNLWRDVSAKPLIDSEWQEYSVYQNRIQYKVIQILRNQAGILESHD